MIENFVAFCGSPRSVSLDIKYRKQLQEVGAPCTAFRIQSADGSRANSGTHIGRRPTLVFDFLRRIQS
jgi:hypothetical protein